MSQAVSIDDAICFLRERDRFLLLTHCRPDGDTAGSASALCQALRELGKTAYLLNNRELTDINLPYAAPYFAPDDFQPDTVVAVDIAALIQLPDNAQPYAQRIDLAIDHHSSQTGYARRTCLDASAAACGEIVYDICRALTPMNGVIAARLYAAIATDTGGFIYSNTTDRTHRIAAELMKQDFDCAGINKRHFRTKTKKRLLLEAALIHTMRFYDQDRIVVVAVPLSLMAQLGATENDADELASLAALVEGTDCAITLRELGEQRWKVSLRTGERVNASRVCSLLGGGGHPAAAGCTLEGDVQQVTDRLLQAISQVAEPGR